MTKRKWLIYLGVFLAVISMVSLYFLFFRKEHQLDLTSLDPNLYDQSWLTGKPCSAPCWQGLEPGKSLQKDAVEVAKGLSFLDNKNVKLRETLGASFLCIEPPNELCVAMGFENEVLTNLWIYPNYQITIEQAVKELGPPDSFYFSYKDPESNSCNLSLLWRKRQMILGHGEIQLGFQDDLCDRIFKEKGKIPMGLLVQSVNYVTSSEMEMIVETVQKTGTGQNYMLWKGFSE